MLPGGSMGPRYMFCNFYWAKNHKLIQAFEASGKIRLRLTNLRNLENVWCRFRLIKINQILPNNISLQFVVTTKPFIGWKTTKFFQIESFKVPAVKKSNFMKPSISDKPGVNVIILSPSSPTLRRNKLECLPFETYYGQV